MASLQTLIRSIFSAKLASKKRTRRPAHLDLLELEERAVPAITINPSQELFSGAIVGVPYNQSLAANGGSGSYVFSETGNLPVGLNLSPTGFLVGTPQTAGNFTFTVSAKDKNTGSVGTQTYTLKSDLGLSLPPLLNGTVGLPFSNGIYVTPTGGSGNYQISQSGNLPAGLAFSQSTGQIFQSQFNTPLQAGLFPFTVTATDSSTGFTSTQTVSLNIGLGISPTSPLIASPLGTSYTNEFIASGGNVADSYSFTASGSLPPGLTLSSAGQLTGIPTQAGIYSFTVMTSDIQNPGLIGSRNFTLPVGLLLTPSGSNGNAFSLPPANTKEAYFQQVFASGGSASYDYAITNWKDNGGQSGAGDFDGLSLDKKTGILKGTPEKAGVYTFTISATDKSNSGLSATQEYTLNIGDLNIKPKSSLEPGTKGKSYSKTFEVKEGTSSYSFTILNWQNNSGQKGTGSFNGLSLDSTTGVLSGIPAQAGQYQFTIQAQGKDNKTGQKEFKLVIFSTPQTSPSGFGPLTLSPGKLTPGLPGVAYAQQISAFGGNPGDTYSYALTGALPTGMVFQPDGTLVGTPTQVGTYNFTVTTVDNENPNLIGSRQYTLAITNNGVPATSVVGGSTNVGTLGSTNIKTTQPIHFPVAKIPVTSTEGFSTKGGTIEISGLDDKGKPKTATITYKSIDTAKNEFHECTGGDGLIAANGDKVDAVDQDLAGLKLLPVVSTNIFSTVGGTIQINGNEVKYSGIDSGKSEITGVEPLATVRVKKGDQILSGFEQKLEGVKTLTVVSTSGFPSTGGTILIQTDQGSTAATYTDTTPTQFNGLTVSTKGQTTKTNFLVSLFNPNSHILLSPTILPPGTVGSTYLAFNNNNYYQVTASGGNGAYTFSVTDGILPPGLSLSSSSGIIISNQQSDPKPGIPTAIGTYAFTVKATDQAGNSATQQYSITIQPATPQYYSPQQVRKAYGIDNIIFSGGIKGDGTGQTIAVVGFGDDPFLVSSSNPSATISSQSDGQSIATAQTIYVDSTQGFPDSGSFPVVTSDGTAIVNYTSKTDTSFQGCTTDKTKGHLSTGNALGFNASDLHLFNEHFGIPDPPSFVKLDQYGGTNYPKKTNGDNSETGQDVQWVHALAPGANIILFVGEESSNIAIQTALNYPGVTVVSHSYTNFPNDDQFFLTPSGKNVTFVTAGGDNNNEDPPPQLPPLPAAFPYVLAAGMTALSADSQGNYVGEAGNAFANWGASTNYTQPAFQNSIVDAVSKTQRTTPDVSFIGEASSTFDSGAAEINAGLWTNANGTSLATPSWAAMLAIANQGRALSNQSPLNGPTDTLPMLYNLPASDFNKITNLDNGSASQGNSTYNQSGLGTPIASRTIPGLVGGHNTISGQVRAGAAQAGWTVFLSANPNGVLAPGQASTTSDVNGNYSFLVAPGTYYVNVIPPPNWGLNQLSSGPIVFAPGADHVEGVNLVFSGQPNQIYVDNLYQLLLGRDPGPGSQFFVNELNNGVPAPIIIEQIQRSAEYLHILVNNLYQHYLNRSPDAAGAQGWVTALQNGMTVEQVTDAIVSSPEFYQNAGSTNAGYVSALYQYILGREGESSGLNSWTNALDKGASSIAVARGFTRSLEYFDNLVGGAQGTPVDGQADTDLYFAGYYPTYLQRQSDPNGLFNWVQALVLGQTNDQSVLARILGSREGFDLWSGKGN